MLKVSTQLVTTVRSQLLRIAPIQNARVGYLSSQAKDDDGSSSSDDEKSIQKKSGPQPVETAAQRLNRLLGSMATDQYQISPSDFPHPGDASRHRREALKQEAASKDVLTAAKNIASMLGTSESEKRQTESELLSKLLGKSTAETETNKQSKGTEDAGHTESIPNTTDKELNLSELIVGMKIDRRQQPPGPEQTRGDYVRRTLASRSRPMHSDRPARLPQQRKREAESFTGSVNLHGGEPLGIFKKAATKSSAPDLLQTWEHLSQHELSLHASHPPANHFEQLAQWTEQGKVWRFPIDNEQDMIEESIVDFSEHIFLDQHLEPWCPSRGPIRHFMELVCVGLSKNPHVSAQEKKEHILWFRDYFEAKKDLLRDLIEVKNTKSLSV
ncbi:uncharacterized protein Dwil_GK24510 [Drosophila willistoni]|uniref:Small ribosomal subunit protein mS31 n=1 Tax=Drosophila willistoni TaxID=7260 RepID=B4N729_DROWI|nr:28S ribosomal protein S31, mitochondrial [Drosophila willistoni]EDW80168.1 uncharacterized protein Dwil_GK24510 [Drosophila willistoni]